MNQTFPHGVRRFSDLEWDLRLDLAAAYRLIALHGMDDAIFTHISVRVPAEEPTFLINPYGRMFEEITASSLVKINVRGELIDDDGAKVNPAGFDIHSAIHMGCPDAHCVVHTHTTAGMAVAALKEGLLPLNQMALHFHERIASYSFDTIHFNDHEKKRLIETIGDAKALIMENHGLLTCGHTIASAFHRMFYLEKACQVQVAALSMGRPIVVPSAKACADGAALFERLDQQPVSMWQAFRRKLDREQPDYAS
ncbi:class II aldolase/adducin family protein [Oceanibacterium hippocampi]|uniref:Decarboxylase NovR n=1 Tax=Oceanibacterium hippocampi TaxID=745714 RepID=A0A1Y5TKX1_9PROT|nr:class II aldolase/adducin family protein [Oceanibacterium hippocampi]SLN66412.1 Decarboxylase NovR [Oceanibacterium hippocampi]